MKNIIATAVIILSALLMAHAQNCLDTTTYNGSATFYNYTGFGNCSFPVPASPIYTVALNPSLYDTSATCGTCMEITGPLGSVVVSVEDQCPGCASNSLDLSEDAFSQIENVSAGIASIQWKFIPCPVTGNIILFISNASNPYYIQVQVRNHRYAVSKVEFKSDGSQYVTMQRGNDNFFTISPPVTPATAPLSFRITDVLGNIIEEDSVPFTTATEIAGSSQFPECITTDILNKENNRLELTAYPNPSVNGIVTIAHNYNSAVSYHITDCLGKEIKSGILQPQNSATINYSEKGIYIIRYSVADGKIYTRKFIAN
jgi:expansin (peptidoglycan-binding protein)